MQHVTLTFTLRLDRWDTVLGCPHAEWIDDCELVCRSFLDTVTDVTLVCNGVRLHPELPKHHHSTSLAGLLWHQSQ